MNRQNKIILSIFIIVLFILTAVFSILFAIYENYIFRLISHILFSLFKIPILLLILYKIFRKTMGNNLKKFVAVSGAGLVLSALFECARIIFDGPEVAGVLFFPLSIPVAIFGAIYYSKGIDETINQKRTAYYISVPLLILSIYFETYFIFN